jgi:hypothetical protein
MKKLLIPLVAALTCFAFASFAQTPSQGNGRYTPVAIPLPATTLAAATSTNLLGGWTNTTTSTNIVITWSPSTAAFVTNSTITTNNTVTYANFDAQGQRNVGLQFEFNFSGATTTNVDITIAKSVTGINFDTVNTQTFSFAGNGTTLVTGITNIDMTGFGFGRVITLFNRDSVRTLTNSATWYGNTAGARRE